MNAKEFIRRYRLWVAAAAATLVAGAVIVTQLTEQLPPEFVEVDTQPVPIKQVNPEYPESARRIGAEGRVWVKIWVDVEGKARDAAILMSENDIFNEPALRAARQWVFTPAEVNNEPVAVWVSVPFRFKLQHKPSS